MPERPATITTSQLARLLLLTERRIQQLVRSGILKHAYDPDNGHELRGRFHFVECNHAYIRYLRNEFDSGDVSETRFLDARSRRMVAMAEREELALRVLRGKLHRAEDVQFVMTNRDSAIKAQLLGIPSRVARLCLGKSDYKEVYDIINDAILAALELLAAYNPHTFNEHNEKYLATLFPEAVAAKPNGNGEGERIEDTEATETDAVR
jgi:phage terminase Nu1 subunit (DNA packaging protein)